MELLASPGATSFPAHVIIRELDLPITVRLLRLGTGGDDLAQETPLGRVPAIRLDDGTLIGENSAILPFLADQRPGTDLFAPAGTVERAQIQSWIGYVNSEIHGAAQRPGNRPHLYSDDPSAHDGIRKAARKRLREAYAPIEARLTDHDWLVGDRFTIADAYLGVFVSYLPHYGEALAGLDALTRFSARFEARPTVQAARAAEGPLPFGPSNPRAPSANHTNSQEKISA
ncbi:glutathione S-transferase protein [Novosphingobium sp. Rr 2-17]|uniref:glutathione binding-like protein n=1 Tax=Novosphingobium sp. Rr 2-17 TaxID=555793 RepID=UPI0002698C01|nr:glutathione binding-like protein [Novosphingobium sp. Rr 2-17]EIZ78143.1 glutathione S-transferase protein [Novosphingobium sp. Rr 2-17]